MELHERCDANKRKVREMAAEMLEQEYIIRKEVSKEFSEQLTVVEEEHRYVGFQGCPNFPLWNSRHDVKTCTYI